MEYFGCSKCGQELVYLSGVSCNLCDGCYTDIDSDDYMRDDDYDF